MLISKSIRSNFKVTLLSFLIILICFTKFLSTFISISLAKYSTQVIWSTLTSSDVTSVLNLNATGRCEGELRSLRRNASFWQAKRTSSNDLIISYQLPVSIQQAQTCLSTALFSARLLSHSAFDPSSIVSLDSPVSKADSVPGVYTLSIPNQLEIPFDDYILEIRLEWTQLIGAEAGMVCGFNSLTCDPIDLYEQDRNNESFIGKPLKIEENVFRVGVLNKTELSRVPLCRNLTSLPGFYSSKQFFPTPSSKVCSLPPLTLPPPFSKSLTLQSKVTWIQLVGDSNLRNLYSHLSTSFGEGIKSHHYEEHSETHTGNIQYISLLDFSGVYNRGSQELPSIIISWQWWTSTKNNFESNAEELRIFSNETLGEFLNRSKMHSILGKQEKNYGGLRIVANNIKPTRVYISLGSHSEELTSLGTSKSLDVLLSSKGIQSLIDQSNTIKFFTTTLVQSSFIPEKFPHQDLVRNNFVIRAKNQILMNRVELKGRVIDIGQMTEGITENWMKEGKKLDAVHFSSLVYDEWVKIVWSDLMN